ncbi:MAG: hypothetical protein ACPG4U_13885, partial [Pseudomonadales bacterium]
LPLRAEEVASSIEVIKLKQAAELKRKIHLAQDIAEIHKAISGFVTVKQPLNYEWTHSIRILGGPLEGSWLYNATDGYFSRLNYTMNPSYKVIQLEAFNTLVTGSLPQAVP